MLFAPFLMKFLLNLAINELLYLSVLLSTGPVCIYFSSSYICRCFDSLFVYLCYIYSIFVYFGLRLLSTLVELKMPLK